LTILNSGHISSKPQSNPLLGFQDPDS